MRNLILSLLVLLLTAPALSATENAPADAFVPEAVPNVVAEPAPDAGAAMHLSEIHLEERTATSDVAAAQLGPRGGFWWIVGVIVVAGVILAVVL